MIKKSAYKSLLAFVSFTLLALMIIVTVLRGTGYWSSNFDRNQSGEVIEISNSQ